MPGRKASCARPLRWTKYAAIATASRLLRTKRGVWRWISRAASRTATTPTVTQTASAKSWRADHRITKTIVGRAASSDPRGPPICWESRLRTSSSTVRGDSPSRPASVTGEAGNSSYDGLKTTGRPSRRATRPVIRSRRPGSMPGIWRRPSQTTVRMPLPSYSSPTRAGTLARGRRVTVRSVPQTTAERRSGSSLTGQPPSLPLTSCRSSASSSLSLLTRPLRVRRRNPGCCSLITPG